MVYLNIEYSRENECMHLTPQIIFRRVLELHPTVLSLYTKFVHIPLTKYWANFLKITGEKYAGWCLYTKFKTLAKLNEFGFKNIHIHVVRPYKIFVEIKYSNFRIFLYPGWSWDVILSGGSMSRGLIYREVFLHLIGWEYMWVFITVYITLYINFSHV